MYYPTVSVMLVNYNSKKYAEESINSILSQNYPKSKIYIIVVDNASSDGSIEFLKEKFGNKIRLIESKENRGFAGGTNLGFRYAKGEFILLFNIDAIAPKDYLRTIVSECLKNKKIVAVGSYDFPPNTNLDKEKPSKGYTINLVGGNVDVPNQFKTIGGGGVGLLIRRSELDHHLFDEDYFLYFEETKFGWECNIRGYEVICSPKCKIWHYGSAICGKVSPLKTYYSERNRVMSLLVCFELGTLMKISPLFLIDSALRFGYYLLRPKLFVSYLKAMGWIITHIPLIITKKREFNRLRKLKDRYIFHLLSYKLFTRYRTKQNAAFWNTLDFLIKCYLKLVKIRTGDMEQ